MTRSFGDMPWEPSGKTAAATTVIVVALSQQLLGLWQPLLSLRHFKRPIGLAIAEPEVQVISLSDKELHGIAFFQGQCANRENQVHLDNV